MNLKITINMAILLIMASSAFLEAARGEFKIDTFRYINDLYGDYVCQFTGDPFKPQPADQIICTGKKNGILRSAIGNIAASPSEAKPENIIGTINTVQGKMFVSLSLKKGKESRCYISTESGKEMKCKEVFFLE